MFLKLIACNLYIGDFSVKTSDFTKPNPSSETNAVAKLENKLKMTEDSTAIYDQELAKRLDNYSLEAIIELKISRFLEQIDTYYPENLYTMIMRKAEKPLLTHILRRTGGNQVHAAKILGINRNTLRKKMKLYSLC